MSRRIRTPPPQRRLSGCAIDLLKRLGGAERFSFQQLPLECHGFDRSLVTFEDQQSSVNALVR
jgi:hypothetical protein